MIIDFHAHMGMGTPGCTDPEQMNLPAEMIVESARAAAIDISIVCPVQYLHYEYSGANEEVAAAVRTYSHDLVGLGRVHPFSPDAIAEVTQAVVGLGLRGLKLHHACDWFEIDSAEVRKVVGHCGDLGVPVLFHSPDVVPQIVSVARDTPHTIVVLGHMGGDRDGMRMCTEAAEELPNLYLETSRAEDGTVLAEAAQRFPDRLLLGTDAVHERDRTREVEKVRRIPVPEDVLAQVLGENAARLLNLQL
jgi:uncharacterized protein